MMSIPKNNVGMQDHTGQQLGNYRLTRSLELNKFSGIYQGEHIQLKRQCLVEVWRTPLPTELVDTFLTQARALGKLVHPHILRVCDAGVEDLVPFVVMDPVSYVTLQRRIAQGSSRPLADILPYVRPIAEALQYAHNNGVLHKQIRPRYILLDGNSDVVLISNFTIDVLAQGDRQPNLLRSKDLTENLGYMAPEQMTGKALPASDQYALAVVLYEWLSGDLPFRGSYSEIVNQHMHVPPSSLRKRAPTVSRAVEEVIFTALAKDPQKRFPTLLMFAEALEEAQKSASPMAPVASRGVSLRAPSANLRPFIPAGGTLPPQALPAPVKQVKQVVPPPAPPAPAPLGPILPIRVEPIHVASATFASPAPAPGVAYAQPAPLAPASVSASKSTPRHSPAPARRAKGTASITRRTFVAGLVGVAVLGGGVAWLKLSPNVSLPLPGTGTPVGSASPTAHPDPQVAGGNILVYRNHPARVTAVSWSPDGTSIASASDDHTVQICDARTGKLLLTYRGHSAEVFAVSWSPNGKYIASAGADKTVQIWDAATGALFRKYTGHTDQVNAVSWSPVNSTLIASGGEDNTVQVWNITNGQLAILYSEHTSGVLTVAWSPDNTVIASGSWDNTVKAFSTITTQSFDIGGTVFDYRGHTAEVYSVAWSPDGTRIASASGDKVVQVGNGINGSTLFTYTGHSGIVLSVAWSPDGTRLASASADNTVQIWSGHTSQKTTNQKLFTYQGHSNAVYGVAWAPGGKQLASASSDDTMQVWQPV